MADKRKKKKNLDYPGYYLQGIGVQKREKRNSRITTALIIFFFIVSLVLVRFLPDLFK